MTTAVFTHLSEPELRALFRQELESYFTEKAAVPPALPLPEIGGIEMAMEITGLKRPTIYGLTSSREIPHYRQGKRLYFKRAELLAWIESGRKLSRSEMAFQAAQLPRKARKSSGKGNRNG